MYRPIVAILISNMPNMNNRSAHGPLAVIRAVASRQPRLTTLQNLQPPTLRTGLMQVLRLLMAGICILQFTAISALMSLQAQNFQLRPRLVMCLSRASPVTFTETFICIILLTTHLCRLYMIILPQVLSLKPLYQQANKSTVNLHSICFNIL